MDYVALALSLRLGALTVIILLPLAFLIARALAYRRFPGHALVSAAVALPLVLPPTVLGYYLLTTFSPNSASGAALARLFGGSLAFSFEGLLLASVLINLPFAVQPIQNALEAIPANLRDAGRLCGMGPLRLARRVELPLAWPGIVTAAVLCFAHTLGEFGVVLMVGGSIPGETRTLSIAIYERVQAFDDASAGLMSAVLLVFSLLALALVGRLARRRLPRG